jgi:hypothetical protein
LLRAEPAERAELLRSADPAALGVALQTLGHTREVAAAEVLAQVDQVIEDRALRKAARREQHRLRSMGIEPSHAPSPAPEIIADAVPDKPDALAVSEAWATDIDPTGTRGLWLLGERPLGGMWFGAFLVNDLRGMEDLTLVETTRKRFLRDFESSRGSATWIELPGEYSLGLVRESVDLTREIGGSLPTRYQAFRDVFGEAAGPPERGQIYETISPVEINFNPSWIDDSPRLLGEPEVGGWYVPVPTELRTKALEVARAPMAGLLVPGHTPEQQALQLVAEASERGLTPVVRHGLQRRLEETAYIFLETDRLALARLAAAAALALEVGSPPPERQPLIRLLLAAGLARLTGSETAGSRRASEVLLELVERASQQQSTQGGAVETRPSGLILPR